MGLQWSCSYWASESQSIDLGSFSLVVKPEIHDTHPPIRAKYDSPRLKYSYPIGPNGCGTWSFCRIFYQNIGMGTAMLGLCWTASIIEMVHMRPAAVEGSSKNSCQDITSDKYHHNQTGLDLELEYLIQL